MMVIMQAVMIERVFYSVPHKLDYFKNHNHRGDEPEEIQLEEVAKKFKS